MDKEEEDFCSNMEMKTERRDGIIIYFRIRYDFIVPFSVYNVLSIIYQNKYHPDTSQLGKYLTLFVKIEMHHIQYETNQFSK